MVKDSKTVTSTVQRDTVRVAGPRKDAVTQASAAAPERQRCAVATTRTSATERRHACVGRAYRMRSRRQYPTDRRGLFVIPTD
jgi:hypothetical protein